MKTSAAQLAKLAKLILTVSVSFFAISARAESTAITAVDPDSGANQVVNRSFDPVLDDGVHEYSLEISAQAIGDYGAQGVKTFSDTSERPNSSYRSTDGLISITGRKAFSREIDLSLTLPIFSSVSTNTDLATSYTEIKYYPASIGVRYHLSFFSDQILPFAQVDIGEAVVYEKYSTGYGNFADYESNSYARTFGKVAFGTDILLSRKNPVYLGVKVGYLAMKELGSMTSGIDVGYSF